MAKKTDEFVRRLARTLDNSNFYWVEQMLKELAKEAFSELKREEQKESKNSESLESKDKT